MVYLLYYYAEKERRGERERVFVSYGVGIHKKGDCGFVYNFFFGEIKL